MNHSSQLSHAIVSAITGALFFLSGNPSIGQDLERIQNLVQQAREIADNARGAADENGLGNPTSSSSQSLATSSSSNPFSSARSSDDQTQSPRVQVDPNVIEIDAGGRKIQIPRFNSPIKNKLNYHGVDGKISAPVPANHVLSNALEKAAFYQGFAESTQLFGNGQYDRAQERLENTMQGKNASEVQPFLSFYGLCLFANGDYGAAAEQSYAAISNGHSISWPKVAKYYVDQNRYAEHYRQLQVAAKSQAQNASIRFLLGYHHLLLGHRDHARSEFEYVQTQLPEDPVVRRMLELTNQSPPGPLK